MRRPLLSTENFRLTVRGIHKGDWSLLWGEPAIFAGVGGTHPPRLPLGERERGVKFFFLCLFAPSPHRPASIRTLDGAYSSGAIWGPQWETGAAISAAN